MVIETLELGERKSTWRNYQRGGKASRRRAADRPAAGSSLWPRLRASLAEETAAERNANLSRKVQSGSAAAFAKNARGVPDSVVAATHVVGEDRVKCPDRAPVP